MTEFELIENAAKEFAGIKLKTVIDTEERYFNSNVRDYDAFKAGIDWYKNNIDKWNDIQYGQIPEIKNESYVIFVKFWSNEENMVMSYGFFEIGTQEDVDYIIKNNGLYWKEIK